MSLRAVRRFADKPVQDDIIRTVLEAARWCGSGKNGQPWQFIVIRQRNTLQELSKLGEFAGHLENCDFAIALAIASASYGDIFDTGRVAQSLMLAASAFDIGSCIAFILPEDNEVRAQTVLRVPNSLVLRVIISFGYPALRQKGEMPSGPPRDQVLPMLGRKPLNTLVFREHYGAPLYH